MKHIGLVWVSISPLPFLYETLNKLSTDIEVIDLTHPTNVELFRKWDQKEAAYVQQLRFIRISSAAPETVIVSRAGHHPLLKHEQTEAQNAIEPSADNMDMDEAPLLLEPQSRFASTIQTMDGA